VGANKEITKLIKAVQQWAGWRVEQVTKGWMLYPPDRSMSGVLVHRTPSDHRALKNIISLLRKRGAPV